VPFHRIGQLRDRRLQTFPTDAVGRFPDQNEGSLDGFVVEALALNPPAFQFRRDRRAQQPNRVFTMVSRHRCELIENRTLFQL
jgi:hypothetical protein